MKSEAEINAVMEEHFAYALAQKQRRIRPEHFILLGILIWTWAGLCGFGLWIYLLIKWLF